MAGMADAWPAASKERSSSAASASNSRAETSPCSSRSSFRCCSARRASVRSTCTQRPPTRMRLAPSSAARRRASSGTGVSSSTTRQSISAPAANRPEPPPSLVRAVPRVDGLRRTSRSGATSSTPRSSSAPMASSTAAAPSMSVKAARLAIHGATSGTAATTALAACCRCWASRPKKRGSRASAWAASVPLATSASVHQRPRSSTSTSSSVSGQYSSGSACGSERWLASTSSGSGASANGSYQPASSGPGAGRPSRSRARRIGSPSARRAIWENSASRCSTAARSSSATANRPWSATSARLTSRTARLLTPRVSGRRACHPWPASVRRHRRSTSVVSTSAGSTLPAAATIGGMAASRPGRAAFTSAASGCHVASHQVGPVCCSAGSTRPRNTNVVAWACTAPNHATEGLTSPCSTCSWPSDASVVASSRWDSTLAAPVGSSTRMTRDGDVHARLGRRASAATSCGRRWLLSPGRHATASPSAQLSCSPG